MKGDEGGGVEGRKEGEGGDGIKGGRKVRKEGRSLTGREDEREEDQRESRNI